MITQAFIQVQIKENIKALRHWPLWGEFASFTNDYSSVYSGADQRKHQSSASLAFVRGIHRWPVNSPHKGLVTRKMFPFDDIIMSILYLKYSEWCDVWVIMHTAMAVKYQYIIHTMNHLGVCMEHWVTIKNLIKYQAKFHIDESAQERPNSIANALELRLSCTNTSICVQSLIKRCHYSNTINGILSKHKWDQIWFGDIILLSSLQAVQVKSCSRAKIKQHFTGMKESISIYQWVSARET